MELIFDRYKAKLTLTRSLLATNPSDPNVMDTHILQRQRKLITENSELEKEINKYLNAIQISAKKGEKELQKVLDRLEELMGYPLNEEQRVMAIEGKLESLRETFQELDLKGTTVFFWDKETNKPVLGDHMISGFLKAAAEAIGRTLPTKKGEMLHSISYTQSIINQHFRCDDPFLPINKDVVRKEDGQSWFFQRPLRAMTAQGPRVTLAKSEVVEKGAVIEFTFFVLQDSPLTEKILRTLFSYGQMVGLGQWRNGGHGLFKYELDRLKE